MGAIEISWWSLGLYVSFIIIPIFIFLHLKLRLFRTTIIAVIRMALQLGLVGIYLEYLFKWNHPLINIAWLTVMILVANHAVLKQSGLDIRIFFFYLFPAFALTLAFILASLFLVLSPEIFLSSRYFIPIGGMILGNILRGNVVALERFFHALTNREEEYIYYISLGATLQEAVTPLLRESVKASIAPFIGTMATLGLVSLPGMMTGQILGGNSPLVAIQYQIMIMIAIFVTYTLSIFLAVRFTLKAAVDPYGRIRKNIFTNMI